MNRRVAVRGIILQGDKLLCVRLKQYAGKTDADTAYWCLPGGGVDPGEPLIAALRRELVEELGVEPTVGALLYVQQFPHNGVEQMELFFHVTNSDDFLQIDLAKASHGAIEIERAEFIDPATTKDRVLPTFLTTEPLAQHVASASPPKFFDYLR
ncbi:MAG TPA: NUDIX domain-containing protein [Candidatus Saccharimonadales bacterium]|nr:NUDIX domain-containing protein [Candidatus Saccharimonadales bacterium]